MNRRDFLECVAGAGAVAGLGRSVFGRGLDEAVTSSAQATAVLAPTDSRLPDGTAYAAWEQPLTFSKTYYVDNSEAKADDNGPGTKALPFRTDLLEITQTGAAIPLTVPRQRGLQDIVGEEIANMWLTGKPLDQVIKDGEARTNKLLASVK